MDVTKRGRVESLTHMGIFVGETDENKIWFSSGHFNLRFLLKYSNSGTEGI